MKVYAPILLTLLAACSSDGPGRTPPADAAAVVYYNGDILTMEGDEPQYVEAVVVRDGKIAFVGTQAEAMKAAGAGHTMADLKGRTMVPGFIDPHCHFTGLGAQAVTANLLASPDGNCNSMDELVNELKDCHAKNGTTKTQGWILGMGFDDAVLKENRFPTREDLDRVSTTIPICIVHISGHFCAMNSKALELKNITASTVDPAGGVIRRLPGSKEPNGVLEENAAFAYYLDIFTAKDPELADYYLDKGQDMAASYGYTTVNEGMAVENHEQMADYAKRGKLKMDLISYVNYAYPQYLHSEWNSRNYKDHYRVAGVKATVDGSPQGRTAWRSTPYLLPPDGQEPGYAGYPAFTDAEFEAIVDTAFKYNWQMKAHCNGDAAMDQWFRALNKATARYGQKDRRNILVHGQLIRMDQLDSLKKYDIVGSFFPMHTFYWGDWYKQIIGPEKAQQISPIRSALNKGIHVNSHTDAPVAFPNLMMVVWCTVNRVSRSGEIMGPEERLTAYDAMRSITSWAAYQFFEDETKGSITTGKLADFVILGENPLKVAPMAIKDIQVLETIKEGRTIYAKP